MSEKQENRESVGYCYVCKKERFRDESELWVYHVSVGVVCKHHHGVMIWYNELLTQTKRTLDQMTA